MVSPTILECIAADLIKLTRDPEARSEFPTLNMVPNMIPRVSKLSASSPTPSGGRVSRLGGQLDIAFPPGGALLQGTELQLGSGLRSAMSQARNTSMGAGGGRTSVDFADRARSDFGALPPPPRKAGLLADSELLSGDAIRALGVVTLFKTEPMLKGKCTALYVRDTGCTWDKCNYLSVRKFYCVNFDEFTVFFEAGDEEKNKEPRAMHLDRRDLDCHLNLRHPIFVFAITPNVLLFHHRDSRMTPVCAISDISRWREYYASGVGCFRTFSSRRWYSDQFPCKKYPNLA